MFHIRLCPNDKKSDARASEVVFFAFYSLFLLSIIIGVKVLACIFGLGFFLIMLYTRRVSYHTWEKQIVKYNFVFHSDHRTHITPQIFLVYFPLVLIGFAFLLSVLEIISCFIIDFITFLYIINFFSFFIYSQTLEKRILRYKQKTDLS